MIRMYTLLLYWGEWGYMTFKSKGLMLPNEETDLRTLSIYMRDVEYLCVIGFTVPLQY